MKRFNFPVPVLVRRKCLKQVATRSPLLASKYRQTTGCSLSLSSSPSIASSSSVVGSNSNLNTATIASISAPLTALRSIVQTSGDHNKFSNNTDDIFSKSDIGGAKIDGTNGDGDGDGYRFFEDQFPEAPASSSASDGGYSFFEDQFPADKTDAQRQQESDEALVPPSVTAGLASSSSSPSVSGGGSSGGDETEAATATAAIPSLGAPPRQYASYEDQLGSEVLYHAAPVVKTRDEKLRERYAWKEVKQQKKQGGINKAPPVEVPENFGWDDEKWGADPTESGHNPWYKKPRTFMSTEEKHKHDMSFECPLPEGCYRQETTPYEEELRGGALRMNEEHHMERSSYKAKNVETDMSIESKKDTVGQAKSDYIDSWLEKDGVEYGNLAKKVADHHGWGDKIETRMVQRRPEWQMSPASEDDD